MKKSAEKPDETMGDYEIGLGQSCGSFGELLQGTLPDGGHFLVTLPIQCYSFVKFFPDVGTNIIEVFPKHKTKTLRLAQIMLDHYMLQIGGKVFIHSDLPEGKGLSSSSADLVAAARAISSALRLDTSPELIARFLGQIEPTDGVMYPYHVFFYHRKVEIGSHLGSLPGLMILGIDEGGVIDTVVFNKSHPPTSWEAMQEYDRNLKEMKAAFERRDLVAIGRIATRSAILNQAVNPKRFLPEVLEISIKNEGLGVVVTHSGPCLGILLSMEDPDFEEKQANVKRDLQKLGREVLTHKTISSVHVPGATNLDHNLVDRDEDFI